MLEKNVTREKSPHCQQPISHRCFPSERCFRDPLGLETESSLSCDPSSGNIVAQCLWAGGGAERRLYNRNLFLGDALGRGSFMSGELEHSHSHLYVTSPRQAGILSQQGMRTEGVNMTQHLHRARYMESQKCRRAERA